MTIGVARKLPVLAFLTVLLVLAACRSDESDGSTATARIPATMTETTPPAPPTVTTASPSPVPTKSANATPITTREAGAFVPDAYTTGILIEDGGCQWIVGDFERVRRVIIWPHGFVADSDDGTTIIRNVNGKVVGRVGERIGMRGGNIMENRFDSPCAADNYWIAGEPIEVLPTDSPTPTAS